MIPGRFALGKSLKDSQSGRAGRRVGGVTDTGDFELANVFVDHVIGQAKGLMPAVSTASIRHTPPPAPAQPADYITNRSLPLFIESTT